MAAAFLLAIQAASASAPAPPVIVPVAFDLAQLAHPLVGPISERRCAAGDSSTIIVCARRSGVGYPMARWALVFPPESPLRAETDLGGGATGRAFGESVTLDRGAVSQRMMVGITFAF